MLRAADRAVADDLDVSRLHPEFAADHSPQGDSSRREAARRVPAQGGPAAQLGRVQVGRQLIEVQRFDGDPADLDPTGHRLPATARSQTPRVAQTISPSAATITRMLSRSGFVAGPLRPANRTVTDSAGPSVTVRDETN